MDRLGNLGREALSRADAAAERRVAFEAVALPFMRSLYNTALRLTRRPEDASDLVQETFLRAYRTFDNFARGTNAKAWLFTIQYSVFVNRYHKERREPIHLPLDEIDERFLGSRSDEELAGRAFFLPEQATGEAVDTALREIPESFRAVVLLVDVEELSYEEAAAVLGCPVGTVRSRLSRGRSLLFAGLQDHARSMGYVKDP